MSKAQNGIIVSFGDCSTQKEKFDYENGVDTLSLGFGGNLINYFLPFDIKMQLKDKPYIKEFAQSLEYWEAIQVYEWLVS